jgi:hypothetical protein
LAPAGSSGPTRDVALPSVPASPEATSTATSADVPTCRILFHRRGPSGVLEYFTINIAGRPHRDRRADLERAAGTPEPRVLRTLEAIQLATVMAVGEDLEGIVTHDEQMIDAAIKGRASIA